MSEYIIRPPEKVGSSLDLRPIIVGEIVRCRDCRCFRKMGEKQLAKRPSAKGWCVRVDIDARPDGFCAWGERKEGGA